MTRSRILTALFALFVFAAFVQPAAAHYDPKLGRWLERDPLGVPAAATVRIGQAGLGAESPNLYQYALSSPTVYIDDTGLYSKRADYVHAECARGYTKRRQKCLKYAIGSPQQKDCYADANDWVAKCNNRTLDKNPILTEVRFCRRNFDKTGADCKTSCVLGTADALSGGHGYLQRGPFDPKDFHGYGLYDTDKKAGDPPNKESASLLRPPFICEQCHKRPTPLKHGSAAQQGTLGVHATDEEIWDCIKNHNLTKDYSAIGYNCHSWANEAARACGLECPDSWGEAQVRGLQWGLMTAR